MWPAFPASDYYGPSAPARGHQPTAGLPAAAHPGRRKGDSGTVPTFTMSRSTGWAPSSSPEASPRVPRRPSSRPPTDCIRPASESLPAAIAGGVRCDPAHIHQVGAGVTLEGVRPLVHFRCAFPSRWTSTGPSGGADPPRRRRSCSRHPPRFRDQAAPELHRAAATARPRSPSISARSHSASWRTMRW